MDPQAFTSTKDFTTSLSIDSCDCEQLDLIGFLAGFNHLEVLHFYFDPNIHRNFPTLPKLSKLSQLKIASSSGNWEELVAFPVLAIGLEIVHVLQNGFVLLHFRRQDLLL